jgi:hypothetical protein
VASGGVCGKGQAGFDAISNRSSWHLTTSPSF